MDVKAYEDAYSIKGRYEITDENVALHGSLYKGKTLVGDEFKLLEIKNDLPGLSEAIFDQVLELLKK